MSAVPATPSARYDGDYAVSLVGVNKWYGAFHVLRDVNLHVRAARRSSSAGRRARASRR